MDENKNNNEFDYASFEAKKKYWDEIYTKIFAILLILLIGSLLVSALF